MTDVPCRTPRSPLVHPGGMDLHQRDMTATFAADVSLQSAQESLAQIGQWLPIDGASHLSLGHLVETNSTGPLRLGFGAWRDLLLGVQFLNGAGDLISAGGRTVKNVAGYDLTKLMVGQRGVFGEILTLTFRTYLRPAGALIISLASRTTDYNALLASPLRPQWIVLTRSELLLGFLGDEPTLSYYKHAISALEPDLVTTLSLEDEIRRREQLWTVSGDRSFRVSVPPARVLEFVAAAQPTRWSADPVFGNVIGQAAEAAAVLSAAASVGGTAIFLNGDVTEQTAPSPAEKRMLASLKLAFDPAGTLRPLW